MDFRRVDVDVTGLPAIDDREFLTVRVRIDHIYQGVFRQLEDRETVLIQHEMLPSARTFFLLPLDLLFQYTAHHDVLNQLITFNLGNEIAEQMATQMLSRFEEISVTRPSNHFAFHARVFWADVIYDEAVTGQRIHNFEEVFLHDWRQPGQPEFAFGGGDRESSANNGVSNSLLEKLRGERRVNRTNACDAIEGPCAICLEDFLTAKELIDMPCRHIFHESCIFTWLKTKNTCPLCRQRVVL